MTINEKVVKYNRSDSALIWIRTIGLDDYQQLLSNKQPHLLRRAAKAVAGQYSAYFSSDPT
jgi:hypothetical protein